VDLATARRPRRLVALAILAVLTVPLLAWHWAKAGWQDKHYNYPARPSGYTQIVNRFGQPCNANASAVRTTWRAADNGVNYTFRFHKKLGGYPTGGGVSTNLDNDVWGHINNNHLAQYVEHGIYGYVCRYIRGTTKWSTHAFGIAVDVSSAEEYEGKCNSTVNRYHKSIWEQHNWYWGLAFCDPMHFQYATGY
jgi:hypothetical protein